MPINEYQRFLTNVKNKMSPYLNNLGFYYDNKIQKFIGFNEYELIVIEFEEFLRDTQLAINFKRYTNILDEKYNFNLPKKKNLYGSRDISSEHWKYYSKDADKSDKDSLDKQLEMITDEMLEEIKLKLKPRILTVYPIDIYIKEKYIEVTDQMASDINQNGYTFEDEWIEMNEELVSSMPWRSNLCNEQYLYVSKKREEILPYKTFYDEMINRYETNKDIHKKKAMMYLSQFKDAKLIEPKYQYYFIEDLMVSEKGFYIEDELKKHGFVRQKSIGCHQNNQEAFYSKSLDIEIYFIIYDGIRWAFSYSSHDEYDILTVKDIEADCEGLCLIDNVNFKVQVDQAIRRLLKGLEEEKD